MRYQQERASAGGNTYCRADDAALTPTACTMMKRRVMSGLTICMDSCTRRHNGEKIVLRFISHNNSVQVRLLSVRPGIECVVPERVATSCTFSAALEACTDDTLVCTRQAQDTRDAMVSTPRQYCDCMPSSPTNEHRARYRARATPLATLRKAGRRERCRPRAVCVCWWCVGPYVSRIVRCRLG